MEGSSSTTRRRYGKFAMPTPPFLHWVRACPSLDPNRQAALPSVQNCTLSAILGQHCLNPSGCPPPCAAAVRFGGRSLVRFARWTSTYSDKSSPPLSDRLHRDVDRNADAGVPSVIQVVTVANVVHVNVVGFVPVRCPVARPRVNATEPIAAVLKPGIPTYNHEGKVEDAEPVAPAIVATEVSVRNAVAVIAAALLPGAVIGLPVSGAMLLPSALLCALLFWRGLLLLRRALFLLLVLVRLL